MLTSLLLVVSVSAAGHSMTLLSQKYTPSGGAKNAATFLTEHGIQPKFDASAFIQDDKVHITESVSFGPDGAHAIALPNWTIPLPESKNAIIEEVEKLADGVAPTIEVILSEVSE